MHYSSEQKKIDKVLLVKQQTDEKGESDIFEGVTVFT